MVINGIEYVVGLYIMGNDGFPDYVAHFEDFNGLNDFIHDNTDNKHYLEAQMCYSLVELIDGEPEPFSWTANIEWKELSKEQVQEEIDNFIEFEKEMAEESEKIDEFSREIHFRAEDVDYKKKQSHLDDIAYVCPNCLREVTDCRCELYPWYLVQIDKLLVPIIRELNSKGYKTKGCCAGHPQEESFKVSGIYISFDKDYDFDEPFPEGGKYSKSKHSIQYTPTEDDYVDLFAYQQKILDQLEDWAEMLFEVDFFDDDEEF